ARAEARRVEQKREIAAGYKALQERLICDLLTGRRTVPQAVDELLVTERARDPHWLNFLRHLYGLDSDRDCVAAQFMLHAVWSVHREPRLHPGATGAWLASYRGHFRVPAVPPWEGAGLIAPAMNDNKSP